MRRIFVDTEWTAVPWSDARDLLWIGLADDDGRTLCGLRSDAQVAPSNERYVADLLGLLTPDVPRLKRDELMSAVRSFCDGVEEFWAWIPTLESFAEWSKLGEAASIVYKKCRDIDLQMLQELVEPWPSDWPNEVRDLNAASLEAGVVPPPRAKNHLHPRIHASWNRLLFSHIVAAGNHRDA
jgi:hypothetical protein